MKPDPGTEIRFPVPGSFHTVEPIWDRRRGQPRNTEGEGIVLVGYLSCMSPSGPNAKMTPTLGRVGVISILR